MTTQKLYQRALILSLIEKAKAQPEMKKTIFAVIKDIRSNGNDFCKR